MKTFVAAVYCREGLFDAFGHEVARSIEELGVKGVTRVRVAQLFRFAGDADRKTVLRIARRVLLDVVAQELQVGSSAPAGASFWTVEVWYKPGVTDAVADTTERAVRDLGYRLPLKIATGTRYEITGSVNRRQVEEICRQLLANALVQEYVIH